MNEPVSFLDSYYDSIPDDVRYFREFYYDEDTIEEKVSMLNDLIQLLDEANEIIDDLDLSLSINDVEDAKSALQEGNEILAGIASKAHEEDIRDLNRWIEGGGW